MVAQIDLFAGLVFDLFGHDQARLDRLHPEALLAGEIFIENVVNAGEVVGDPVIGLGKAGLPLASVIAESGIDVIGVDVDRKKCETINQGINSIPETMAG